MKRKPMSSTGPKACTAAPRFGRNSLRFLPCLIIVSVLSLIILPL
jgi:hypothetical protein